MQNLIPNKVPNISWSQIRLMLGIGLGILICVIVFRRVLNIIIIDMCILGDYSACPCARRHNRMDRMRNDGETSGADNVSTDRQWTSRDAIALVNLGAFTNPYKYLYHNLTDEKRKKILEIILRNKEILFKDCNLDLEQNSIKKCSTDEDVVNDNDADVNCSICLQPADETSCYLQSCSHMYHSMCIKAWMDRSLSCPVCRKHLLSRDELLIILADHRSMLRE